MAYTVKKLAEISGVSVRTLHFYDEIGLLRPAYHGKSGYRYYEEEQLLILQQILFYRELGFELKQIQQVLKKGDFNKIAALRSHRELLRKKAERTKELIGTIDKTIEHLQGKTKMKDRELYRGFSKEKQEEYETYMKNRFGEDHFAFAESAKIKSWSQADWERSHGEFGEICKDLAQMMADNFRVGSDEVQQVIRRHYEWLKKFWTPNRESYIELGKMYGEFAWKKAFEPYDSNHPRLAQFMVEAMKVFSEKLG